MTSRSAATWARQSSTRPSSLASSKAARAYLLAAAVATRHLRDRLLDQLLVLLSVERLPDHLLGRGHHEVRHLVAHRLDRLVSFGVDGLAGGLGDPLRLLLRLLFHLDAQLLRGLAGGLDDALRGLARVFELGLSILQAGLGRGPRLL